MLAKVGWSNLDHTLRSLEVSLLCSQGQGIKRKLIIPTIALLSTLLEYGVFQALLANENLVRGLIFCV